MVFKKWLKKQIKLQTLSLVEQDFAEDVQRDKKFRDFRAWDKLEAYVVRASSGNEAVIQAAKSCFEMWAAQDSKALVDGLGLKDVERLRKATRQVWSWSYPKRLALESATDHEGFHWCRGCKKKVPKVFIDHKKPVGKIDAGYFDRLFCPSKELQALCKKCHDNKTRKEREQLKLEREAAKNEQDELELWEKG